MFPFWENGKINFRAGAPGSIGLPIAAGQFDIAEPVEAGVEGAADHGRGLVFDDNRRPAMTARAIFSGVRLPILFGRSGRARTSSRIAAKMAQV
jgi:hypothetical protein